MADVHVDDADAAMPNAPEQTTEAATAPAAPEPGNEAPLSAAAQPAGAEATDTTVSADPANPLEAKYDEYWAAVTANPSSFQTWTQLISAADKLGDLAKSRAVYDAFLSEYPLCYGYWKKYADLELRHANQEAAVEVFERGVAAIPYSVDLWVHYCGAVQLRPDATPETIRGHYARALTYVASDWRSHSLWDKYLTYEASTGDVTKLTTVYVQILQHPIRELDRYYHGLREFSVTKTASELLMEGQFNDIMSELYRKKTAPAEVTSLSGEAAAAAAGAAAGATEQGATAPGAAAAEAPAAAGAAQNAEQTIPKRNIPGVQLFERQSDNADDAGAAAALSVPGVPGPAVSDALQPETAPGEAPPGTQAVEDAMDCDEPAPPGDSAPPAGAAAGTAPAGAAAGAAVEISDEEIKAAWLAGCDLKYEAAKQEALKRKEFEDLIKRPYFHVKPLDAVQLAAWSGYLQYACDSCSPADCVALHERALIACANYPEFWRRYVFYLLSTADAERARSALDRGTRVYCKQQPSMHLFAARFLEQQGQLQPARDCYSHVLDTLAPGLLQGVVERANFERRHAGLEAACEVYEEAIKRSQGQAAQPAAAPSDAVPSDAALAQPTPEAPRQGLDRPAEGPSDGEAVPAPTPPEQAAAAAEGGEEQGAVGGSGDGGEADAERESALQAAAFLSVKYADFLLRVASDPDRARAVLTAALNAQPQRRELWEAATSLEEEVGGSARVSRVMALFNRCLAAQPEAAASRQLSEADREALSRRAVAFADAYGDAQLLQQVSRRHAELFLLPSVVVETARKRTAAQALVAESRAGGGGGGGGGGDTKHARHSEDATQAAAGNGPLVAAGSAAAPATQPAAAAAMPHAATSGHHGYFQQPAGYNGYASYYSGYPAAATAYGQYPGYGY